MTWADWLISYILVGVAFTLTLMWRQHKRGKKFNFGAQTMVVIFWALLLVWAILIQSLGPRPEEKEHHNDRP